MVADPSDSADVGVALKLHVEHGLPADFRRPAEEIAAITQPRDDRNELAGEQHLVKNRWRQAQEGQAGVRFPA